MNQVWLPLECNEPDLRLWSLNVIALLHSENEKMMEFGVASSYFDDAQITFFLNENAAPKIFFAAPLGIYCTMY